MATDPKTPEVRKGGAAPAVLPSEDTSPLVRLAITEGVDIDVIERLVAMHEKEQDRQAKRDFNRAMAEFQRLCPAIPRNSTGEILTKNGARFTFKYADLDDIQPVIDPICGELGLSYGWDSTTDRDKGRVSVTCIVRHSSGHEAPSSFNTGTKSPGAEMAEAQNDSKAWTTSRRQSLVQAFGLKTGDRNVEGGGPVEKITATQANDLAGMLDEFGATEQERQAFQQWAERLAGRVLKTLEDLPASLYSQAVQALQQKKKARGGRV